jgi:folate-binding protein YgfZ
MPAATESRESLFFDLSARTKLKITGTDRLRFLNGQVSNDVRKATGSSTIAAAILNVKGKMAGQVFLSQSSDCFFADADPELREKLQARFERYIIADDVTIEDVTSRFSIFHVIQAGAPAVSKSCRLVQANRFAAEGWDIWVEMEKRDEIFASLLAGHSFCDDPSMEVFRIEQGAPRWNRELTEEIIPIEANLETTAIDYEKGCYVGQEVISRIKMSGQRNKKLCGFVSVYDTPLDAGMKIYPVGETKEAGWITSAVHSKRLRKEIALGYLKRPFYGAGYRLDAIDPEDVSRTTVRIEIAELPFVAAKGVT